MPRTIPFLAALPLLIAAVPALAQVATTPAPAAAADPSTPSPTTQELNQAVNGNIAETQASNAIDEAIYSSSVADDARRYDDALQAHQDQVFRQDARYRRQLQAYEEAMGAWRAQVAECKKGKQAACDAPTPNPADFY